METLEQLLAMFRELLYRFNDFEFVVNAEMLYQRGICILVYAGEGPPSAIAAVFRSPPPGMILLIR
ncbi:MAG: hypothetical protein QGI24_03480 [Kiritimatiellia bacterium]|jgi:hypothetical protein|nr:hypothetical protein [Kiritimatiellia bacterium]MDP6847825.1 hypothetical protein [Kiritimatiellia bacterium]